MSRSRAVRAAAPAALVLGLAVATAALAAATPKPVVLRDASNDVTGALDLQRAALNLAADGRLRAVITFAAKVTPRTLAAKSGPPGSVCLRVWTAAGDDPAATRPDRLVCVTADKDAKLRAGVYEQDDAGLPRRSGAAVVTSNASGRSVIVRFAQSTLGSPELIRFAVESTGPGCDRTSCIDTVPDGGAVRRLRLRAPQPAA